MAALDMGWYHTNVDPVPAVVWFELDATGRRLDDQGGTGDLVDVIMLGWAMGKRTEVPMFAADGGPDYPEVDQRKNSFERSVTPTRPMTDEEIANA